MSSRYSAYPLGVIGDVVCDCCVSFVRCRHICMRHVQHCAYFMLYKLRRDDDFGIYYLHQVARTRTARKYCNVDWAMHEEFGIALPEDNPGQYVCVATPQ